MPKQFAEVADILRSSQRDEAYVVELESHLNSVLRLFSNETYHSIKKILPNIAACWYFLLTSFSNRQTLGEEYAGILRVNSKEQAVPSCSLNLIWLCIYVGGDQMYDRFLKKLENVTQKSDQLLPDKKESLLKLIDCLKNNKQVFRAMHRSLFYINGAYYYGSNTLTGIRYILLRQWMQDTTYTQSFKWLGKFSLIYLLYSLISSLIFKQESRAVYKEVESSTSKICVLCSDMRKSTSVTPCGHLFCWDCIQECLSYQANCPVCREFIRPSRIVRLQNYI